MIIKNKKAKGHVEFIISFVLFVGFLVFLFAVFNPFEKPADDSEVDQIYNKLEEHLQTTLSSISIQLTSPPAGCFNIISITNQELITQLGCESGNIIVKDSEDVKVSASSDTTQISIDSFSSPNEDFFTISCSEDFELSISPCASPTSPSPTLGIVNNRDLWSYEKLGVLKTAYELDYTQAKQDLGLSNEEFAFKLFKFDDTLEFEVTRDPPKGIDVYAKSYPIDVLKEEANEKLIKRYKINILTW